MIRLKELEIQNYKSLVNTRLKLNNNLISLIGVNGAGKTNTLTAITLFREIARGNRRHGRYGLDKDRLAHSELIATFENNEERFKLKAVVYFDSIEGENEIRNFDVLIKRVGKAFDWIELNSEIFDFLEYLNRADADSIGVKRLQTQYLPKDNHIKSILIELAPFLANISYYGATLFSDPSKSPISFELEDERLVGRRRTVQPSHRQFLYDLYLLKSKQKVAFKRYLNTVNDLGVGLVSDINFSQIKVPSSSVKILAGGQAEKITTRRTFVVPVFTIDDLQLSPTQLSEGTFKTLALIFYILNDKSQLMLIEEPEVCVHHGLLSSVIELIKRQSKQKQIVLSTHSDYVLDKLQPQNIVLIKKEGRGTLAETLDEAMSDDDFSALKLYLEESGNLGEYWKEDGFFGE